MDIEDHIEQEIIQRKRRNRKKPKKLPLKVNKDQDESENPGDCFYQGIIYGEEVTDERESKDEEDSNDSEGESSRVVTDAKLNRHPDLYEMMYEGIEDDYDEIMRLKHERGGGNEQPEEKVERPSNARDLINTRPITKTAETYELEKFEKNTMVILNQENIYRYEKRKGSAKDVEGLTKTFEQFGFEVKEHPDLTREGIFSEMDKFFSQDFSDYGCIAIAILTHGSSNGLLLAKDISYYEAEILNYFKADYNPSMLSKPKILIIQACRGKESRQGLVIGRGGGQVKLDEVREVVPYSLPLESDMVVVHSSYIGKPSHRDEVHGSWFIQSLCTQINKLAKSDDFLTILGKVNKEVAIDKELEEINRATNQKDINKQTPLISTTLTRKLYLKKYDATASEVETSLDNMPATPLMMQFGPCLCFLGYFEYMKNCLRHFVEENPDDLTGLDLLHLAETFDGDHYNSAKERLSRVIRNHFEKYASDHYWFKYVHIKHT